MDLLRLVQLLLLVVVDGVRQLSVALGEVDIENRLGNATWRGHHEVEGPRNPFVHADVGQSRLLAERRGQILRMGRIDYISVVDYLCAVTHLHRVGQHRTAVLVSGRENPISVQPTSGVGRRIGAELHVEVQRRSRIGDGRGIQGRHCGSA